MGEHRQTHLIRSTTWFPTERDTHILEAIARSQFLTTEQISRLFFPPTETVNKQGQVVAPARTSPVSRLAKERLSKLAQNGYIYWVEQPGLKSDSRPYVAFLTQKGADYIQARTDLPTELVAVVRPKAGGLPWTFIKMRERYLINETRIRVQMEAAANGFSMLDACDERTMRRTHKPVMVSYTLDGMEFQDKAVISDWFFMLSAWGDPFSFVVEIDTGSESGETRKLDKNSAYSHKIAAYLKWFTRPPGGLPSPCEVLYPATEGKTRVLTITLGKEERLGHLKQITERLGGKRRFWLTTFERLAAVDSLLTSPVWSVASEDSRRPLLHRSS